LEVFHNVERAAKILNLNENTFTRHYLDFEEAGYTFKRSQDNKLLFSEEDIKLFKEFLELKKHPKMTKKKAIEQLVTTPTSLITIKPSDLTTLINTINGQFEEFKTQSKQELQELKEQLQEFKLLEDNKQKEEIKQRDKLLMESMRESRESKKLMLEVKAQNELIMKEIAAAKENTKNSWWKKLFSK
jgi:hypothetical protein